jgi:FkbM family methyltransferase
MNSPNIQKALLPFGRRLRYALTPKKLYAGYRAARDLRSYEPELKMLHLLVDAERNAIDGGANRGSYAHFLSKLCHQVYAFEPNPVMRDYLERATGENVTVYPEALSDRESETLFTVPKAKNGFRNTSGTLQSEVYPESTSLQFDVMTKRMDDFPIYNVGFIKLDVEGHELNVLKGAEKLLLRDRPILLIEITERLSGQSVAHSIREINAYGYRPLVILNGCLTSLNPGQATTLKRSRNVIFLPHEQVSDVVEQAQCG